MCNILDTFLRVLYVGHGHCYKRNIHLLTNKICDFEQIASCCCVLCGLILETYLMQWGKEERTDTYTEKPDHVSHAHSTGATPTKQQPEPQGFLFVFVHHREEGLDSLARRSL